MIDTEAKLRVIQSKQFRALTELVEPARAAFNAMKDAKMDNSAHGLGEVLFQLDAIRQELTELIKADPTGVIEAIARRI